MGKKRSPIEDSSPQAQPIRERRNFQNPAQTGRHIDNDDDAAISTAIARSVPGDEVISDLEELGEENK